MPHIHPTTRTHEIVKAPNALVAGQSVAAYPTVAAEDPFPELAPKRRVAPMILWGAWPGEEPLEELLGLLDGNRLRTGSRKSYCQTSYISHNV